MDGITDNKIYLYISW